MGTVNTPFHLRERMFKDLRSVRHSSRTSNAGSGPAAAEPGATVEPPQGPGPVAVDPMMFGEPEMMAAHLLPGPKPALIDPGPANTADLLIEELRHLGVTELGSIVMTHIHFDHAAGASKLAEQFPDANVYIHGRVAAHLIDPERLIEGVRSVWGDSTHELFGTPGPIEAGRVVPIDDGDRIDLGDRTLTAIATPGHTRAHLAYLDDETGALFCGDAIGIQLPGSPVIRPSTPPSDFSYPDALASIRRLDAVGAQSVHLPHFGQASTGPDQVFADAEEALSQWHERFLSHREASDSELDLQRRLNACVEATLEPVTPVTRKGFEAINPVWLNIAGMTGEAERHARRREAA
jgi:glyoxylase-like metal-dependent hydrolase (beta-lactamase superfamily II)